MLTFLNGTRVKTLEQWEARKAEMWELLQLTFYGTFPKASERPSLASFRLLNASDDRGVRDEWWEASWQAHGTTLTTTIEILRPAASQPSSPLPVFITQTNHRRWALVAVSRGYLAMVTPTADNNCAGGDPHCTEGDPTEPLTRMFPNATFQLIARRSYLTSLCIDFLLAACPASSSPPPPPPPPKQPHRSSVSEASSCAVDAKSISMTGHSRNGKQTLIAAALDERITAVMDSSSGVPAMSTYRFSSAHSFCETPQSAWPGPWWLPSVRQWAGREDEMPCDSHFLLGLIAPRPLLAAVAWTEAPESIFSVERSVRAGEAVYAFLNASGNLRLDGRPGAHHGFESVQRYVDWADFAFGRLPTSFPPPDLRWPKRGQWLHDFNVSAWLAANPKPSSLPPPTAPSPERIASMLGSPVAGAGVGWSPGGVYEPAEYLDGMVGRDYGASDAVDAHFVDFGSYLRGKLLVPKAAATRGGSSCLPGVVWLHPLSYQSGWVEAYGHAPLATAQALAAPDSSLGYSGAVVLAFDQVSFGMRQHEGRDFYARQPVWSKLGRMVEDARSAVDVLTSNTSAGAFRPAGQPDRLQGLPCIDSSRIVAVGYSIGGSVALHAAALDDRVSAVASVSGFEPLRTSTDASRSGGNRRWFEWHGTQPQLAWFHGNESNIPYDFDDVLGLVAPRPALVYAPLHDRENDAAEVAGLVGKVKWQGLQLQQPDAFNVMDEAAQAAVKRFIASLAH